MSSKLAEFQGTPRELFSEPLKFLNNGTINLMLEGMSSKLAEFQGTLRELLSEPLKF